MSPVTQEIPVYIPPSKGFLSLFPPSWVPYAELIRLDRVDGLLAFYYPFIIGISISVLTDQTIAPVESVISTSAVLLAAVAFLRFAAVSYNDNMDADLDRRVRRCWLRPIARGAVSSRNGYIVASVNLAVWFAIIVRLPRQSVLHAMIYTVLHALYPLSKRVTAYTPVLLGVTFAWGFFVGFEAMGEKSLALLFWQESKVVIPTLSAFTALVLWVIIFETTYAYQDIRDDEKEGINSLAVRLGSYGKLVFSTLSIIQVCLLGVSGLFLDVGVMYFVCTCGGTAVLLTVLMWSTDLRNPTDCFWFFKTCIRYVGGSMLLGFLGENIGKALSISV